MPDQPPDFALCGEDGPVFCHYCGYRNGALPWPCPTIRALEGTPDAE